MNSKKTGGHAAAPRAPWPLWKLYVFWGYVPRRACPPPTPSPPTSRGVGQSPRAGIKWLPAHRAPSGRCHPQQARAGALAPSMWARLTRRTLLSLALGLLLLSPDAAGSCSNYQDLLQQLRAHAALLQDHKRLLDPYMQVQGLTTRPLRDNCRELPGAFPSEDALRALSRPAFLRAVQAALDQVLRRLPPYLKHLPRGLQTTCMASTLMYIRGFQNNIYCMAQLLPTAPAPTEPPRESPGASPTPAPNAFRRKVEDCQLLRGYHRFMLSVGRVFGEWEPNLRRSRRHSAPRDQAWRTRAAKRAKRFVSRGQRPR